MKIRTGFVSNSSSSSFVILGFAIPTSDSEKYGDDCIYNDDICYIGEHLTKSGDFLEDANYSLVELVERAKKIAEKYNVDINDVKVYMGTYPC